jgi:hypothetical protein
MDSREYIRRVFDEIIQAEGVCVHAYTHGPESRLITADIEFSHPPLLGVNYNFKNFADMLEALPTWAQQLPVYITEVNHLYTEEHPNPQPPTFGWVNDDRAVEWIDHMYTFLEGWNKGGGQQVMCAILYRYPNIDQWVIQGKSKVVDGFRLAMQKGYRPYK